MRPYSIEELDMSNNRENQSFTYNVLRLTYYRRALLLLNHTNIDEADAKMERNLPAMDIDKNTNKGNEAGV